MYIIPPVWIFSCHDFWNFGVIIKTKLAFLNLDVLILFKPLLFFIASGQMQRRVEQLVTDSFGPQFYGKALDCLKALRQQSIKVTWWRVFILQVFNIKVKF